MKKKIIISVVIFVVIVGMALSFFLLNRIGVGITTSRLISHFAGWTTLISIGSIALAFLFAGSVGVFFGFYPARKASKLDPIEALRYE